MLLGVIDRQVVEIPEDAEVIGARESLGHVFLKIRLGKSRRLITRAFYVLDDDRIMGYPNLGYVCNLRIGEMLWHVLEDDLNPNGDSECTSLNSVLRLAGSSPSLRRTALYAIWYKGIRKVPTTTDSSKDVT